MGVVRILIVGCGEFSFPKRNWSHDHLGGGEEEEDG